MPGPLLETKLHVPRRRRNLVARARLRVPLDADAAVTLVSAPAGFGKTTLVADWVGGLDAHVAWVSLDERDDEPTQFWTYVTTALGPTGEGALAELSAAAVDLEAVLAVLVNDLSRTDHDVVLVLDDLHAVGRAEVHEGLAFLVDHLPERIHLVVTTRSDPPLPLARLRARGELVEVRAADLRFTPDEAGAYLNGPMGLALDPDDVAALEERTEGWAAALQLAALSMQGRGDPHGFIADFAGDDRYVVDYLAGEVLERQPEDVHTFLLETSILTRLTGPLCDAVTGGGSGDRDGGATLDSLERANLFLIPLDDRRRWYRYHHLFADVLRARLLDEHPERVDELHRRAAAWWDEQGDPAEAIAHALAGHDPERAADLVERAAPGLHQTRGEATIAAWLDALPDEVIAERPVLTVDLVGVRMVHGQTAGVAELLDRAEVLLSSDAPEPAATPAAGGPAGARPEGDAERRRRLPTQIAVYRAGLAHLAGDPAATIAHAERALALMDDDEHLSRGSASALLGLALWSIGDLSQAADRYGEALDALEAAGHLADAAGCAIALADMRLTLGRRRDAAATFERALALVEPPGGPVLRGAADMHVGLAGVALAGGDLAGTRRHLDASHALGDNGALPQNPYRWRVVRAHLCQVEGDLDAALALLDEAAAVYFGDYSPDVRPVPAVRARLRIRRGELHEARRWADERQLSPTDEHDYLHEFEHVTLARLLLAEGSADAEPLLDRLLVAADAGGRTGTVVEVLVLQALARQARGDVRAALVPLDRALELTAPEGDVRAFLDEGPPMVELLQLAAKHGTAAGAAATVLAAAEGDTDAGASGAPDRPANQAGLVEPLSERELDVLRLLRSDLSGPDIARELIVSLNTVRTHTKHIYAKLGVTSRRAAVRRADELGL
ncbi:MAG: hypothetical protein JNK12_16780 [Acidimicrobiales bacterium]|nr:hypothetical protein [Acidimicrobiales bacterium]